MPSSLCKIWIHVLFTTKNRIPLIESTYESKLHSHIKQHLEYDLHCFLRAINGTQDHIHLLFLLNPNYAIKDILKNVKGESSHWVNSNDFITSKFAWQKSYTAVSIADTSVKEVERFVESQKERHRTLTYLEEHRQLLRIYGMQFKIVTD